MALPLRRAQHEMWAILDFFRGRVPQYKNDVEIAAAPQGSLQPDIARKVTRVLAPVVVLYAGAAHFVRTGRCTCFGWLLLEGGKAGYSAAQVWDYWLSLHLIAVKQMRKGGAGQSCSGPRSSL